MKKPGYRNAAAVFVSLVCLLFAAHNAYGAGDKRSIEPGKGFNVSFEVPVFLPPEAVEGNAEKGAVIFGTKTERGMFERLFAVYWGKEAVDIAAVLPAERYAVSSGEPDGEKAVEVNGHPADFSGMTVNITHPCGQVSEGSLLVCRFHCPETGRYFLFLDLLETVTKSEFRGIVESFKCH